MRPHCDECSSAGAFSPRFSGAYSYRCGGGLIRGMQKNSTSLHGGRADVGAGVGVDVGEGPGDCVGAGLAVDAWLGVVADDGAVAGGESTTGVLSAVG